MGIRNIAVTITGDGSSLSRALIRSGTEIESFTRKAERSNDRLALSWKNVQGAAALTAKVATVALLASGVAAAQFESRMRNVNSLLADGVTTSAQLDAAFRSNSRAVLDLTKTLPQSANNLAQGLYDITSSGFAGADALRVLNASAQAASAGMSTTANAAQAIDAVLNAYGLSASSAKDVSDTLFQTVNKGVITFDQLTGVIGDTVGTAAAAHVPIEQVGAAIATMTLNGLSAEESGTSLNRVLQSLINPSKGLEAAYRALGITSGESALQTKGLQGVMEELGKATGGSVEALLSLFPEIRAARGAFALLSNEGKTYTRVSAAIVDENARQGATHRALAEQMKATSYQLKLFENEARIAAISVGTHTLPVFVAFLHGTQQIGQEAVPLLRAGVSAVTPMFTAIFNTGGHVVAILGELLHAVEPVGAALLKISGAAIIGGLTAVAKALEVTTGFLADHSDIVKALAAIYLTSLLPSVTAVTVAFNRLILTPVVLGLANVAEAAGAGAVGVKALAGSMLSLQAVAGLGVAVALYSVFRAFSKAHEVQSQAKDDIRHITQGFNALDTKKAQATIAALREKQLEAIKTGEHYTGLIGTWRAGWETFTGSGNVGRIAADGREASKALDELQGKVLNTDANMVQLANATGLSVEAIRKLALAKNIDLSAPAFSDEGIDSRKQVLDLLKDMAKQSGTTGDALASAANNDAEAMERLVNVLVDVQTQVTKAFQRDTDVFSNFDPVAAADASSKATDKVTAAEQRLDDARARAASHRKQTVSDTIAIRNAQEALTRAQENASRVGASNAGDLAASYRETVRLATRFADDIQRAQQKGLDPGAVTRLLELGPKQAEPILQQLVADHSGRLIKIVNQSEAALARISERVVEQARLTTLAMNSSTNQLSHDLTAALRISGESLSEGPKGTVQSIAKALKLPEAQVRRIAQEYGIILRDDIQRGLDKKPLAPPRVNFRTAIADAASAAAAAAAGRPLPAPWHDQGFAGGGHILGPGTSTSDSIVIRASHGEFMQRAAAVNYYGVDFMERLNRLQIPRFADGGPVVVRVDGARTHSVRHQQDINGPVIVQGIDFDDAQRQLAAKKRRRGDSGGAR